jgi:hypothetical protein
VTRDVGVPYVVKTDEGELVWSLTPFGLECARPSWTELASRQSVLPLEKLSVL